MSTTKSLSEVRPSAPRSRDPWGMLRSDFDDLLHRWFSDGNESWLSTRLLPSLDLSENDKAIHVKMDLPGVDAKDIDIQINQQVLTVSGERKEEKEEKNETMHRVERRCGSFSRSVTLPCPVDETKVEAKMRDGILSVTLPKTAEAQARKIKVST